MEVCRWSQHMPLSFPVWVVNPLTTAVGEVCVKIRLAVGLHNETCGKREGKRGGAPPETSEQSRHPNPCQTCVLVWPVRRGGRREKQPLSLFGGFPCVGHRRHVLVRLPAGGVDAQLLGGWAWPGRVVKEGLAAELVVLKPWRDER
ncbi:hypothetical protein LIA77_01135 [Sarocladium implicatum]|nr:hypothetical protein LIA77_01135 [Sarocladium implicatum]